MKQKGTFRGLALGLVLTVLGVGASGGTALADRYDYLLAPASKCGNETDSTLPAATQESVMFCMHNYARLRAGLAPLRRSAALDTSSDSKTGDLIDCSFSHTACGRPFDFWLKRVGYESCDSWWVGENIAWGTYDYSTVQDTMSRWLNSDEHRANILDRHYREVGFGLQDGTLDGVEGAAVWTAHFGSHTGCSRDRGARSEARRKGRPLR